MKTTFQISAPNYWGFRIEIESNKLDFISTNDIIEDIKTRMKYVFSSLNLQELYMSVDNLVLRYEEPDY